MPTRTFDLKLAIPCANQEAEDAATEAVTVVARQLYAVAQMLSTSPPRLTLTYLGGRGRRIIDITADGERPAPPVGLIGDDFANP